MLRGDTRLGGLDYLETVPISMAYLASLLKNGVENPFAICPPLGNQDRGGGNNQEGPNAKTPLDACRIPAQLTYRVIQIDPAPVVNLDIDTLSAMPEQPAQRF